MTHLTLSRFACVSHLDWRTLFTSKVALTTSDVKILDWYFLNFAQPRFHDNGSNKILSLMCINCGLSQNPRDPVINSGYIAHPDAKQDGICSQCYWPGRDRHVVLGTDSSVLISLIGIPLQYHPCYVIPKSLHNMI